MLFPQFEQYLRLSAGKYNLFRVLCYPIINTPIYMKYILVAILELCKISMFSIVDFQELLCVLKRYHQTQFRGCIWLLINTFKSQNDEKGNFTKPKAAILELCKLTTFPKLDFFRIFFPHFGHQYKVFSTKKWLLTKMSRLLPLSIGLIGLQP